MAANYIKRCMAFGGRDRSASTGATCTSPPPSTTRPTPATPPAASPLYPRPDDPNDLWRGGESAMAVGMPDFRYPNNDQADGPVREERGRTGVQGAGVGGFEIRPPDRADQLLARVRTSCGTTTASRKDLAGKVPPRWFTRPEAAGKWTGEQRRASRPRSITTSRHARLRIRYRHLVWRKLDDNKRTDPVLVVGPTWRPNQTDPFGQLTARPIDNYLGYNDGVDYCPRAHEARRTPSPAAGSSAGPRRHERGSAT